MTRVRRGQGALSPRAGAVGAAVRACLAAVLVLMAMSGAGQAGDGPRELAPASIAAPAEPQEAETPANAPIAGQAQKTETPMAEAPVVKLPPLPEALPAAELIPAPAPPADPVPAPEEAARAEPPAQAAEPLLVLPEPPAVTVVVEALSEAQAGPAPLRLEPDETKLRALLEPARLRYRLRPAEIDSFIASYSARDFSVIWLEQDGGTTRVAPKAAALERVLAAADRDGLDPARLLAILPPRTLAHVPPDREAEFELKFSLAAFLYARDARGGRIEPSRLSPLITPRLDLPEARDVLDRLAGAEAGAVQPVLEGYQPRHAGYLALKHALAGLRDDLAAPLLTGSIAGADGAPLPAGALPDTFLEGPALAFDREDPRVPLLRQRLGLPASGSLIYDLETREAVRAFQRENGLAPNGRMTARTRAALENPHAPRNGAERKPDKAALVDIVIANMERWRWLPGELGNRHVFVNIADFRLEVVANGRIIHEARVIVGKPDSQTPIFSDAMQHLIVNPSWNVPPSILKNEFLPKMALDPDYAARRGFEVVRRGNSISIRQPPGEGNALGNIKFIFPNQHSVYLHDTPSRGLFQAEARALSHGCVRVDRPFALAEVLLSESGGYSEAQLRAMVGRGERMLKLSTHIPIHLTYFTAFVDGAGVLRQRRDLYGHDARLRAALPL